MVMMDDSRKVYVSLDVVAVYLTAVARALRELGAGRPPARAVGVVAGYLAQEQRLEEHSAPEQEQLDAIHDLLTGLVQALPSEDDL